VGCLVNKDVRLLFEATTLVTLILSISRLAPLGPDETYPGTPVWTNLDPLSPLIGGFSSLNRLPPWRSSHFLSRTLTRPPLGRDQADNQEQEADCFSEEACERAEIEDSAGASDLQMVGAMLYLSANDRGLLEIPLIW
jgi:hypothetical protein